MSKPVLGPVVGHATHQSCRLWIAAEPLDEKEVTEDRRTLGVIGVVRVNGRVDPEFTYYFRLH